MTEIETTAKELLETGAACSGRFGIRSLYRFGLPPNGEVAFNVTLSDRLNRRGGYDAELLGTGESPLAAVMDALRKESTHD